jgi:hypothetical protein
MKRKRLVSAILAAGLVLAWFGGPSSSGGRADDGPGLSYGAITTPSHTLSSLLLAPGRRAIRSIELWWAISARHCSSGRPFGEALFAGSVWGEPISVSEAGSFKATVLDNSLEAGTVRYVISGKISGHIAQGSLSGRVRIDKRDGSVVRCKIGPQRWRMLD